MDYLHDAIDNKTGERVKLYQLDTETLLVEYEDRSVRKHWSDYSNFRKID